MKKNSISIVIPIFNRPYTIQIIKKNISIARNSSLNCEFIIINDYSTEFSRNELEIALLDNDTQDCKVLHNNENLGVTKSKNIGISNAKYEWIMFLDSDNELKSDFINNLNLNILLKNIGILFVPTRVDEFTNKGINREYNLSKYIKNYFSYECLPIVRKSCLLDVGLFTNEVSGFEGITWLEISRKHKIFILSTVGIKYNNSSDDRLSTKSNKINRSKNMCDGYKIIIRNFFFFFLFYSPINLVRLVLRFFGYLLIYKLNILNSKKSYGLKYKLTSSIIGFIAYFITN